MGIQLKWYDDARSVIYWRFEEGWTIDHLEEALVENRELLNTADTRVDLILDMSEGGLVPPNLVRFLRYYPINPHPLSHMKIIIGGNEYFPLFWSNLAPLTPRHWHIHFAGSVNEARTMIEQDRLQVMALS